MKFEKKEINPHQVEYTVRVSKADAEPSMQKAASRLSAVREFKGFRPGKAPYEIVKREFGEAKILEEAMDDIINDSLTRVLRDEPVNPYGKIDLKFLSILGPDEVAVFTATINLIPRVALGNWRDAKVKRLKPEVKDEEVDKSLRQLSEMVAAEEAKTPDAGAEQGDKVVMDLEVYVEGKLIEGGKAGDFAAVIGEGRMIPGFEDKLIGIKPGERREFELSFPDHYHQQESLSGKPANFKIEAKKVLVKRPIPIGDELAKRLGAVDLPDLKLKLKENALQGKEEEEEDRLANEAIKKLVESSVFGELPPAMVNDTVDEMMHEFEHNLARGGMKLEAFLKTSGKTVEQVRKEFEPKAEERIKASLALVQLAEDEKITVDNQAIDDEIKRQEQAYAGNPRALEDLEEPEYRRYVANSLLNRKVVGYLKEKLVEQ